MCVCVSWLDHSVVLVRINVVLIVLLYSEVRFDKFGKYVRNMDDSVRHLMAATDSMTKRHQGRKC